MGILQRTCLQSSYSLRTQLLSSFGASALLSLIVVVILACTSVWYAGEIAKSQSNDLVRTQVKEHLFRSTFLVAEKLTAYMTVMEGTVELLHQAVTDRIVGYPNEGWEEDRHVPFTDIITEQPAYPINMAPPPLEWQIESDLHWNNSLEHLGWLRHEVLHYMYGGGAVPLDPTSTGTGAYFMQGACDPSVTDPKAPTYHTDCTDENNNIQTGGKLQPTSTNAGLHAKSGDLTAFLKALYESQFDAFLAGIYFSNSGAGSTLHYPGFIQNGNTPPYESIGCDWMLENINPHTGEPFATPEEVSRCHKAGARVPYREFNPMERDWCRTFALKNNSGVGWYGPFLAAGSENLYFITVGKAVFDRKTGHFIGCVSMDTLPQMLSDKLAKADLQENDHVSLLRYDNGAVVGDTQNAPIGSHGFESQSSWEHFKNAVDFSKPWTLEQVDQAFQGRALTSPLGVMTAFPLPVPPDEYDPDYRPKFLAIHAVSHDIFETVYEIEDSIDRDVLEIAVLATGLGVTGMVLLLLTIWCCARTLTQPLLWIENAACSIVNHSQNTAVVNNDDEMSVCSRKQPTVRCVPRTEIDDLVYQFKAMIRGFSGTGAARVAGSELHEIPNVLTWHSDFSKLYSASHEESKSYHVALVSLDKKSENHDDDKEENGGFLPLDEQHSQVASLQDQPHELQHLQQDDVGSFPPQNDAISQEGASSRNGPANSCVISSAAQESIASPNPVVPAPRKRNRSHVIEADTLSGLDDGTQSLRTSANQATTKFCPAHSRLFWGIFVLIVLPLLATNAVICVVVSQHIVNVIPSWVQRLESASAESEGDFLVIKANAKASLMTALIFESVRELHLMTRFAGWISFGGVPLRNNTFIEMDTPTERCKAHFYNQCPWDSDCACEWEDYFGTDVCTDSDNTTDPRYRQKNKFTLQASDFDPLTGDRVKSTYPLVDTSPDRTVWWTNVSEVPGADQASSVKSNGYFGNSYDRLRVAAAMSIVQQPTFNYATTLNRQRQQVTSFMCFAADGLFSGDPGCRVAHSGAASWSSTVDNRASAINPGLCPVGKFGYDCRCRGWYADGEGSYKTSQRAVHVTAPYLFPGLSQPAASATSPIANPSSGEYVGQMLLDFRQFRIFSSLEHVPDKISFVITPQEDELGGNTVVPPNKTAEWQSAAVSDLLFQHEDKDSPNRKHFETHILAAMQNGSAGLGYFEREKESDTTERLLIAYAPVLETTLLPVDPSDFTRGCTPSFQLVYSVAFAETEESLHAPFYAIQDAVERDLKVIRVAYIVVNALVSMAFVFFTCIICVYVTKPMIALLSIVKDINKGNIDYDLPPLRGGSREVQRVYNTFVKLYKIIRISNNAFFSRNLSWAHHFLTDALELFRKVNDRKAIGIACNNLGNTLFAMTQDEDVCACCAADENCIVNQALNYYDEAVDIAQAEFAATVLDEDKAYFALQLSDRLFNRSLFLLQVDGFECSPSDARQRGYDDMRLVRHLDNDAKEFWLHTRLLLQNSGEYFFRLTRRIYGLAALYDDVGLRDIWDVKELVQDADQLLFCAWNEPNAPLFDNITRIGRLQQLEGAAIFLSAMMGNEKEAATLAMRMFAEDEFLLECAFGRAAEALLKLTRNHDAVCLSNQASSCVRVDIGTMLKSCKNVNLNTGKCLVFAIELSKQWEGSPLLEKVNANCLKLYDRHCAQDDYMSIFAYGCNENLAVELGAKDENEGRQRTLLDIATQTATEVAYAVFPTAFQMVVDSNASIDRDSFLIVLLDGNVWDLEACASIKTHIERLNRERTTAIHVYVVALGGLEHARVREQCRALANVTKSSLFADATLENIDQIFETIGSAIAGAATSSPAGVTMEKF